MFGLTRILMVGVMGAARTMWARSILLEVAYEQLPEKERIRSTNGGRDNEVRLKLGYQLVRSGTSNLAPESVPHQHSIAAVDQIGSLNMASVLRSGIPFGG